ncbi:MAG TPA: ATP-binding protein, partial [Aridibacter sp.]|nr:ATP-binding protein [Aridibacter sp.]
MSQDFANAFPRKNFFIQMFTKDIGLEDCILDLVDNSIDGLIRTRNIELAEITNKIFAKGRRTSTSLKGMPIVRVDHSTEAVEISDNCGGIEYGYAKREAFNFGHGDDWQSGYLGVYGVGMKRALFKIGNKFEIESRTIQTGFFTSLIVSDWLREDSSPEDWQIPLRPLAEAKSESTAGTVIKISDLHDEVQMRLGSGSIDASLFKSISRTYAFFIREYVRIYLNGNEVLPFRIPVSKPEHGNA